jgi:hypothetical protein
MVRIREAVLGRACQWFAAGLLQNGHSWFRAPSGSMFIFFWLTTLGSDSSGLVSRCWPSPAQLNLESGPVRVHDQLWLSSDCCGVVICWWSSPAQLFVVPRPMPVFSSLTNPSREYSDFCVHIYFPVTSFRGIFLLKPCGNFISPFHAICRTNLSFYLSP